MEPAGAKQRADGGRNGVREREGRLSFCLLLRTLHRLEGVQCYQCNYDSLIYVSEAMQQRPINSY